MLAIHAQHDVDYDLPARVIDRLSLSPLHTSHFDEASLCTPNQLNAYPAGVKACKEACWR